MGQDSPESKDKPSTTLPGTVEKIIKPIDPSEPEKAQIHIEGGRSSIVRFVSPTPSRMKRAKR